MQVEGKYHGNDFLPCPSNISFWATKRKEKDLTTLINGT